ncbi:AAA domain-containing protein [Haploplasma axanthum]|uniref:Putative DNA helicase n=1 Tax=Haploplasma axanthum TaxID=29552 RepID=A0A449BC69_HAPAX|nr:AAA domain-containing protein [Haploplasma axanthum]VEU79910.1 putative DNA helicase [Haploplasma axanthum]
MIKKAISKAIKNRNWISIEYLNKKDEITNYWIAINDIDIENKGFRVSTFNVALMTENNDSILDTWISFDKIQNALLVENTKYDQPNGLIDKIESNLDRLEWLEYDTYSNGIIDYVYECMINEESPYQRETTLVKGIDQDKLEEVRIKEKYFLTYEQISDLVPKLEILSKQDQKNTFESVTLVLNMLSISTKRGLYVVAYKELDFNPKEKSLVLSPEINFNYTFAANTELKYKHHLKNYLDIDTEEFTNLFTHDQLKAKNMLHAEVLKHGEELDDKPYIMDLTRIVYIHIEKELDMIKLKQKEKQLSTPLKAFFGNMTGSFLSGRTRTVDVVLMDDRVNIDQLRVIYNSLTKPITYVQGPPGTGKTQTIINGLISAFFNGDKVLVSSNNNKPINDIYDKIMKLKSKNKNKDLYLPFIRLGNKEETLKSLNYIKKILPIIEKHKIYEDKLEVHARTSAEDMKKINELLSDYEERVELEEEIDSLTSMKENLNIELRGLIINQMIYDKRKRLESLPIIKDDDVKKSIKEIDDKFLVWLFFTGIKYYKRIFEPKNKEFLNILYVDDEDEKSRLFNSYLKDDKNFSNFQKIFPVILTTNQSAHRLGSQSESFDLVIIDEAGQSSIGYSLFAIARAKRLLLVGDQNQLKPVISMAKENNDILMKKYDISESYDYIENSILLSMQKVDTVSKYVLLRYHYRSHRDIINFSNKKYYNGQLKIPLKSSLEGNALEVLKVDTSNTARPTDKNTSLLEIDAIIRDINEKKYTDVGVITPFRNQANLIEEAFKSVGLSDVAVGTVHTFQGDEKDVIYLSSAITKHSNVKSFDWLKNNQELINVATTRAKKKFILVSDFNEIKRKSEDKNDFYELAEYTINNGKEIELTESTKTYFINGANFKNYDTKKEKEFLETINHLLTTADKYVLENKVRIASILNIYLTKEKYDFALKGEFDLVISRRVGNQNIPVVVVELDGKEHKENIEVIKKDKIKEEICRDNNIEIKRIDNKYSRRYIYIKSFLGEILR